MTKQTSYYYSIYVTLYCHWKFAEVLTVALELFSTNLSLKKMKIERLTTAENVSHKFQFQRKSIKFHEIPFYFPFASHLPPQKIIKIKKCFGHMYTLPFPSCCDFVCLFVCFFVRHLLPLKSN